MVWKIEIKKDAILNRELSNPVIKGKIFSFLPPTNPTSKGDRKKNAFILHMNPSHKQYQIALLIAQPPNNVKAHFGLIR